MRKDHKRQRDKGCVMDNIYSIEWLRDRSFEYYKAPWNVVAYDDALEALGMQEDYYCQNIKQLELMAKMLRAENKRLREGWMEAQCNVECVNKSIQEECQYDID